GGPPEASCVLTRTMKRSSRRRLSSDSLAPCASTKSARAFGSEGSGFSSLRVQPSISAEHVMSIASARTPALRGVSGAVVDGRLMAAPSLRELLGQDHVHQAVGHDDHARPLR